MWISDKWKDYELFDCAPATPQMRSRSLHVARPI